MGVHFYHDSFTVVRTTWHMKLLLSYLYQSQKRDIGMPPKKTATVKKTVVASNSLSQVARASPAPKKKTGQDEGVKAPDMLDMSSEHSVCPICENVIVDAGETSVGEDAIYCEGRYKRWIHRCCGGLTKHEFLELRTKTQPIAVFDALLTHKERLLKNYVGQFRPLPRNLRSSKLLCLRSNQQHALMTVPAGLRL